MLEDKIVKCHRFELSTTGSSGSTYLRINGKPYGLVDKLCIFADSNLKDIHISGIKFILGSDKKERFELDFN